MARQRAAKDHPAPTGPEMTAQERVELDARLASMFTKPNKSDFGDGRFFLLWLARDADGSPQTMMWNPETEEELRGANFFHDAAHGLGAFAKKVAKGKPFRRSGEETALINAILQDRDEETGYLVYADYLTENGYSQGDFIRLCIELEHLKPGDAGYDEKNARQGELIEAHAEEWYAALGELGPRPDFFGTFMPWMWLSIAHGVIEEVVIDRGGILPANADRLFAAAPFLRKLEFEKGHADAAGLAKVKQLAQIEELEFSHADLTGDDLAKLLRSKHLTNLKTLLLNGNDEIGERGAKVLAAWPGLARLETLDVSGCNLGRHESAQLVDARIDNLKRLDISRNVTDLNVLEILLTSEHPKRLTDLGLGGTEIDPHAAALIRPGRVRDDAPAPQPGRRDVPAGRVRGVRVRRPAGTRIAQPEQRAARVAGGRDPVARAVRENPHLPFTRRLRAPRGRRRVVGAPHLPRGDRTRPVAQPYGQPRRRRAGPLRQEVSRAHIAEAVGQPPRPGRDHRARGQQGRREPHRAGSQRQQDRPGGARWRSRSRNTSRSSRRSSSTKKLSGKRANKRCSTGSAKAPSVGDSPPSL